MDRRHWLSDTVAGAVLGYGLGDWFYRDAASRVQDDAPRLMVTPSSVMLQVPFR
jgi:membrane-associated phospholipid phosphatase